MELRKFVAPEFIFGEGARLHAGRYARHLGARKILLVTDKGVITAGWAEEIAQCLKKEGLSCEIFSDISPNPRAEEVMKGAEIYRNEGCNFIVSVGGGSPMDCAKGIGIVSSNKEHVLHFEGVDMVSNPCPPLICIPTTAGTSADVSQFAIITDRERKVKIAIISKAVVPDIALIDPVTLTTMDSYLTACTGMDALCHAIEAYVSNASSPVTDLNALEAIRLITENLIESLNNPMSMKHRNNMMLASLLAGLAFSNASLGAVHAMAHSLGGFLDFPHGEANAILLSYVISHNYDVASERYDRIGEAMKLKLNGDKKKSICKKIVQLRTEAGITSTLGQKGMKKSDIPQLAYNAIRDACIVTNPKKAKQKDIETIYEQAL